MKKLLLTSLLFTLTFSFTAMAEENALEVNHHAEHICKKLDLAPEQKDKVIAIFKTQHEKMQAVREETRTSLQGVLTPEQMTKFDAMREKHQQKRKERMGKNHPTKQ